MTKTPPPFREVLEALSLRYDTRRTRKGESSQTASFARDHDKTARDNLNLDTPSTGSHWRLSIVKPKYPKRRRKLTTRLNDPAQEYDQSEIVVKVR